MSGARLLAGARDRPIEVEQKLDPIVSLPRDRGYSHSRNTTKRWCALLHGLQHRLYTFYTQRIEPFSFPHPISSPPTQNGLKALGRSNPSTSSSCPSTNLTPFSRRATSNRGIAAAVPLRVCANGSGASVSVAGRYRICRRRD